MTFDVPAGWTMPELGDAVPDGGRVERATHELVAVYYDTAPALLRPLGITLRRRAGGPDAGWHLKLPAGDGRTEVHSHAAARTVPAALARRLSGVTAGRPVSEVATIATTRHTVRLLDAAGALLVEVADDEVRGHRVGAGAAERVVWREVEVEGGAAGGERDLAAVGSLVEAAGAARSAQQRKINHVLGEPLAPSPVGKPGLVADYLREQCRAVLLGDATMRDDPTAAAVHHTRVAVRRLRTTVRVFAHTLTVPEAELDRIDAELRWLAGLLSPVRDADVIGIRLDRELGALPACDVVGPVRREIHRALARDRAAALATWREERESERYRRLMTRLGGWFLGSPVRTDERVRPRVVLARADRAVRRRLREADDDAGLHRARKAVKRLRYAAEALAPGVGGARKAATQARRRQSGWGEHQDLVVAAAFLRRLAGTGRALQVRSGFTYGVLVARLDRRAERLRRQATLSR
ncbi:MAG: CYTH and CHAD domain-containing protein [Lapillicoccus sp.]